MGSARPARASFALGDPSLIAAIFWYQPRFHTGEAFLLAVTTIIRIA